MICIVSFLGEDNVKYLHYVVILLKTLIDHPKDNMISLMLQDNTFYEN